MNTFHFNYRPRAWLTAFALSAFVVGCGSGSDDPAPVDPGNPGNPGAPVVDPAGAVSTDPGSVDLGAAGSFVILANAGVTNVPTSPITGNVGSSPITGAAIGVTCAEVTATAPGKIYDTDGAYTGGGAADVSCRETNPTLLTSARGASLAAHNDARDRTAATDAAFLNVGGGTLNGNSLAPGTYTWDTTLAITGDITLQGGATDVWIMQVGGNLNQSSATRVNLAPGVLSKNVFWRVGGANTNIGSSAHFAGIVLTAGTVALGTGASVDGRLYTGQAVTLQQNTVRRPD